MQKVISYRLQNPKKSAKFKRNACGAPLLFGSLLKGLKYRWMLLQKVICYLLDYFACEIMTCMQRRSCFVIPLREHKLEYKNGGEILKFCNYLRFLFSTRPIQPYHFQADQIWCNGTFKYLLWTTIFLPVRISARIC
jgi:hypothetical protein